MDVYKNEDTVFSNKEQSQIQKFYDGLNVLITGGTGFMGKILIEKLLRSTDVSTIYVLIRPKKGKDVHVRMDEIFEDVIFQRMKSERKKFKHRIIGICGDCSISGLGLNIDDRKTLISKIDVIFHAAATVRFDENIKLAFSINVNGTKDVLDLARQMKNIKSIVHISTAYANCHLTKIEEVFYKYPMDHAKLEQILEKLEDREVDNITPRLLGSWPNTYTFTKAMAESLICENCPGLPLGIFRPAIVVSTYKEPITGWIDNLYGPTGVCAGVASGLLRTLHCNDDVIANIVPVDTCVAALLAVAWDVATKNCERTAENVPIFNYVSSVDNPITWGEYNMINFMKGVKYPLESSAWKLSFHTTSDKRTHDLQRFFYHYLPAVIVDTACLIIGQKPRLLEVYKKIHKFSDVISYFCTRDWEFTNANMKKLWGKMNDTDREIFAFDMKNVLWIRYFKRYILGIREYLLKDPLATIPSAVKRQHRFTILHNILKYSFCFLLAQLLWNQLRAGITAVSTRAITYSPF